MREQNVIQELLNLLIKQMIVEMLNRFISKTCSSLFIFYGECGNDFKMSLSDQDLKCALPEKQTNSFYLIKKKQQVRFKQYWRQLQNQNSELIHRIAQQMKDSNEQYRIKSLKALNLLLSSPSKVKGAHPELKLLTNVLIKMLKTTIIDALSNMSASQRELYEEISKMNLKLIEISKKQKGNPNSSADYTIDKLFHFDVASLLLKQNQIFKKEWSHFENLWTGEELQEISLLPSKTARRLYKKHQQYSDYLRYNNNNQKINDTVTVMTLVKIKTKLFYFLKQGWSQFPYLQDIENERQQRQRKRQESQSSDNDPNLKFNFSQLANWSIYNQLQQPAIDCKDQFYSSLRLIMKQPSLWEKKYLILSAKIIYKISFRSILTKLSDLRHIEEQQLAFNCEKAAQEEQEIKSEEIKAEIMCDTFMKFQDQWKNIFLNNQTVREVFDKYGISKDFNVVVASNEYCCMNRRLRNYVFVASLGRFYNLSRNVQAILTLESRIRPLIAIKKYEIVYQNTKTETNSEEQAEDQTRTLILATMNLKVLFFYLLNEKVNSLQYFRRIRFGLKQNPIHSKFTAILFQLNFKQNYPAFLKEFERYSEYLSNYNDSRAYLSSYNKYCDQNLIIFTTSSRQLKKISQKMTKDKFYETLEDEVKNVLTFFK